jgi:hypothetical protein
MGGYVLATRLEDSFNYGVDSSWDLLLREILLVDAGGGTFVQKLPDGVP